MPLLPFIILVHPNIGSQDTILHRKESVYIVLVTGTFIYTFQPP